MLRHSTDFGVTWQGEQIITTIPTGTFPRVTVNKNNIGIVWQDERFIQESEQYRIHLKVSTDKGTSWSLEYDITEVSNNNNIGPDIAINNNYIHVAWTDTVLGDQPEIYYRRGRIMLTEVMDTPTTPKEFKFYTNFPNPFNNITTFKFALEIQSHVVLEVYDMLGKNIEKVLDEQLSPGEYAVPWNSNNLSSGIYVAALKKGNQVLYQKVVSMK
ncbi:MAG: T9SS type A sorting domain-containing protein [Bacteroidetes bacterium]|nr:MAG: T9SS type A sorting domain-containing protein [Bacteroidota bacterium]